jgi:hypothetical protein
MSCSADAKRASPLSIWRSLVLPGHHCCRRTRRRRRRREWAREILKTREREREGGATLIWRTGEKGRAAPRRRTEYYALSLFLSLTPAHLYAGHFYFSLTLLRPLSRSLSLSLSLSLSPSRFLSHINPPPPPRTHTERRAMASRARAFVIFNVHPFGMDLRFFPFLFWRT